MSAICGALARVSSRRFPIFSWVLKLFAVPFLVFSGLTLFGRGGIEERDGDSKELNEAKRGL